MTRDAVGISAGAEHSLVLGPLGPIVKKVTPYTGEPGGGTKVTIKGLDFAGVTAVKFGSNAAKEFTEISPTEISAVSPPGTGKVPVKVTTSYGMFPTGSSADSNADDFRYVTPSAPEFGRCKAVTAGTGKYSNSVCTLEAAGGSYEWLPGVAKQGFTLEGGESTLETVGNASVVCKAATGSGEYSEAKYFASTILKLTSCEHAGSKCTSAGAGEGEVVTSPLEGELGWYDKAAGEVALALTPEEEAPFAEFKCGTTAVMIRGAVLDRVGGDKMQTKPALEYEASKGKQKVERFQGGAKEVLEMSFSGEKGFEQTGLTASFTLTNEEEVEINASV